MQEEIELITIKTFDNFINAHILKTRLESEGIECYLFDENITTLNPLYNVTVGGIKLKIKNIDQEKVEKIIKEIDSAEIYDEENKVIKCPRCNSKELYTGFKSMKELKGIIAAIISFALMVFPIYYKTVYKCKECGLEFRINDNTIKY
jgi:DNA-directed RNA polymerase subunit RPC12/RpoP